MSGRPEPPSCFLNVKDLGGQTVEVNPVHVGTVATTEDAEWADGWHTGQAIAKWKLADFVIVVP